jgi:hypothetical protein
MADVKRAKLRSWDLIYLGRKALDYDSEKKVKNTATLVWPAYTYWMLAYLLSDTGNVKG